MPQRIQMKRTKGWRKPENCEYVGRPTKCGNPFTIKDAVEVGYLKSADDPNANKFVVDCFRGWLTGAEPSWWTGPEADARRSEILTKLPDLRGKDLGCWCPLDRACHADILLELANA